VAKKKSKPARRVPKKTRVRKMAKVSRKPAKKSPAPKQPIRKKRIGGLPDKLHEAAIKVLKDRQAEDIVTIDLEDRSSVADYLIIASGRASRQIAAIADYLREAFSKLGARQIRVEGLPEANWVLVDAGDVIVHLFRPEVRHYYQLEDIWNAKI
jgi:ribosome-associated protein